MVADFQKYMTEQLAALTPIIEKIIGQKMEVGWAAFHNCIRGQIYYYTEERQLGRARWRPRQWVSYFDVSEFPANGNVLVSSGVWVEPRFRHRGLGGVLHAARLGAAKSAGAKLMLCTVNHDNQHEIRILQKNGWTEGVNFGTASLWTKGLL